MTFNLKSILIICILLGAIMIGYAQSMERAHSSTKAKFGGPFTTISFNKYGPSLSAGGGGTFLVFDKYFVGIFGQGTTDAFLREVKFDNHIYSLKSRHTGVWLGYYGIMENYPMVSLTLLSKIGFGRVSLNDASKKLEFYDKSIVFSPNIDLNYHVTNFFQIGLGVFYEFYSGVDLYDYTNTDFNAYGLGLTFKFKKSD